MKRPHEIDGMGFTCYRYALRRKDGKFYNGNAYGGEDDWSGKEKAFTYTEAGACRKRDLFPIFATCEVVRVD